MLPVTDPVMVLSSQVNLGAFLRNDNIAGRSAPGSLTPRITLSFNQFIMIWLYILQIIMVCRFFSKPYCLELEHSSFLTMTALG